MSENESCTTFSMSRIEGTSTSYISVSHNSWPIEALVAFGKYQYDAGWRAGVLQTNLAGAAIAIFLWYAKRKRGKRRGR